MSDIDVGQRQAASDVACAHLANNVGQQHAPSAMAYTDQSWRVRID